LGGGLGRCLPPRGVERGVERGVILGVSSSSTIVAVGEGGVGEGIARKEDERVTTRRGLLVEGNKAEKINRRFLVTVLPLAEPGKMIQPLRRRWCLI